MHLKLGINNWINCIPTAAHIKVDLIIEEIAQEVKEERTYQNKEKKFAEDIN